MGIGKRTWLLCIPLALCGCLGTDSARQSALGEPCASGADCQAGLYCDAGGSGVCTRPCETDSGCGAGFTCYYALCVEVCASDGDCSAGLTCNEVGHCTNPRPNFPNGPDGGNAGFDFGQRADMGHVQQSDLGSATRDMGNNPTRDMEASKTDAGTPSEASKTDAGTPSDHCSNGKRDGDETDVDCGGDACGPCRFGQRCERVRDCTQKEIFYEEPYGVICKNGRCDCDAGYKQAGYDDLGDVCSCDPGTCDTCCDYRWSSSGDIVSKCGIIWIPAGEKPEQNNCGAKGQQCFFCEYRQTHFFTETCVYSSVSQEDYCAGWYTCGGDTPSCVGCCGDGPGLDSPYCMRGDEDGACGKGGAACMACPAGTHCVDGSCQ